MTTFLGLMAEIGPLLAKATPRPWKQDAYHNILSGETNVASTWYTGGRPAKENTALIVAAVNLASQLEPLVKELQGLTDAMEQEARRAFTEEHARGLRRAKAMLVAWLGQPVTKAGEVGNGVS